MLKIYISSPDTQTQSNIYTFVFSHHKSGETLLAVERDHEAIFIAELLSDNADL